MEKWFLKERKMKKEKKLDIKERERKPNVYKNNREKINSQKERKKKFS